MTQRFSAQVVELFTRESLEIHALCDRVNVPRQAHDGSVFSMAQRVAVMAGVTEGLMRQLGVAPVSLQ